MKEVIMKESANANTKKGSSFLTTFFLIFFTTDTPSSAKITRDLIIKVSSCSCQPKLNQDQEEAG
jgi:hypothetical protein